MTAPLTDIEATRLCAVAMGIKTWNEFGSPFHATIDGLGRLYNPLHDDAQAFALVKRFRIDIGHFSDGTCSAWADAQRTASPCYDDLNRAIVHCVAALQRAKAT